MKASIVIPCFNEEENIEKLFKSWIEVIETENIEIIFVNNGSTDNSKIVFQDLENIYKKYKHCFKILNLPENKGYGGGIQEGLNQASGDFLGWCHADNQIDTKDVLNIINTILNLQNTNILLKGSRKNRRKFDNIFTILMSFMVKIFTGEKLKDINAQPKLFPKEFYEKNKNYSIDFLFDLDFLLKIKIAGKEIREIEVANLERIHGEAKGGGSLKGKLLLSIKTVSFLLKYNIKNES